MYRVAVDLAGTVNGQPTPMVYTLGAFWINSGLITTPLLPFPADHATYCSRLGEFPTPAPASTAPVCGPTTETCVECGQVRMTTSTGSALVGDGGGIGFSSNPASGKKYAFYVGGRGNGELAIIDVGDPLNPFKVASLAPPA